MSASADVDVQAVVSVRVSGDDVTAEELRAIVEQEKQALCRRLEHALERSACVDGEEEFGWVDDDRSAWLDRVLCVNGVSCELREVKA